MGKKSVEEIKRESRALRGTIAEELASDSASFAGDSLQLLKFHGTYQQDDRDLRSERRKAKQDKAWMLMVRSKVPGGQLSAEQYLMHDRAAFDMAGGSLRITTRQDFQIHGVLKGDIKQVMAALNESGITTYGACGDVVRNVCATPAPIDSPAHREAQRLALELTEAFLPRSQAYSEIWLDGEKLEAGGETEADPIYGEAYLPRKFKIGIAIPPNNDIDVYTNDLGLAAHAPHGEIEGYTVLVGGGFGMSHGKAKTYPRLAEPLLYVRKDGATAVAKAVIETQRDHGAREDRTQSRMKYLIDKMGIDWFREQVVSRLDGLETEAPKPIVFEPISDPIGWSEQGGGKWFCGVWVECGRIKDAEGPRLRSAFRAIVERFGCPVRLTANQNIIFFDLDASNREAFDSILSEHGIANQSQLTAARRVGIACPALPTCGLALAESERAFGELMDSIDDLLREFGMENDPFLVRMTGCPNGCARPYNADIAFVGRAPKKYAMFVGGSNRGDKMAMLWQKQVLFDEIPEVVRACLKEYVDARAEDESFSDYWERAHGGERSADSSQYHFAPGDPQRTNASAVS